MDADTSDHAFLEQLHELQRKLQFIRTQEFKEAKSVNDVIGVLENLKLKALFIVLNRYPLFYRLSRKYANGC